MIVAISDLCDVCECIGISHFRLLVAVAVAAVTAAGRKAIIAITISLLRLGVAYRHQYQAPGAPAI